MMCVFNATLANSDTPAPALVESTADAARGREVILDRERGHCVLCHKIAQLDAPFQGNIGPALTDVGQRLDADGLRQQIIDPTALNPDSVMPAYFRSAGLTQVAPEFRGMSILTAQEVDDVVAYLLTLDGNTDAK